ncbi:MAG: hypothetical protein WD512_20225 [Candidatus Paceibacterota bacterium]
MLDYNKITQELIKKVGIRQTIDTNYKKLGKSVVFDIGKIMIKHPLLTIENIFECAKQFDEYEFPDYDPAKKYNNDDPYSNRVKASDGNIYEYVNDTPSTGNDPITPDNDFWELLNLETLFLEDIYKNAAYEVITEVMNRKALRYETKSLLQYNKLYNGIGKPNDFIISKGSLVGFEIIPKRNENIAVLINKIGTHFSSSTELKLYLFHTSQNKPKEIILNHTNADGFQWHDSDLKLFYSSDEYDTGGAYYLMYDQDQPEAQAVNKQYDYERNCSYCSTYDNYARKERKDFYLIRPVEIFADERVQDGAGNELMFDISDLKGTNLKTYGLNLSMQANCDLTELVIDQSGDIAHVLSTKIKIDLLHEISLSTRINGIEERTKKEAKYALQSKITGGEGIMSSFEKQIDALDFNLSNLNTRCLPKKKAGRGIRSETNGLYNG